MAKNYFYNLILTLANLLFPLISFPYVSRVLGPEGIGHVQFVFSFAQYFSIIASIGVPIYGMKEISRHRDDPEGRSKVFSELITIHILTSLTLSAIYLAVIYMIPRFAVNREMYVAAVLMVLLGFSFTDWVYSGMEQFRSIALRSVLFKLIVLVLLLLLIKQRSDYRLYLYLMMFSFLGNNVLSLVLLNGKVKYRLANLQLRKHITPLLFILGTTLAASMYSEMDTVLLGFLSDNKTVGFYTAAVKMSKISIPFVTSMAVILMPKIAKDFADNNLAEIQLTLNQTFRFVMFFGVPVAFGLVLLAPEFITLFSGREFLPATTSMRIMAVLPLIIGVANILLFMVLVPSGKNREMFLCVLGGVITSVILNILLIPFFKQAGSSAANICSELVVTMLYFWVAGRHFSFTYQWLLLFKSIGSALVFIPIIWLVKLLHLPLGYTLLLGVAGCGAAYAVMQLFVFKNTFVYDMLDFVKAKWSKTAKA